MYVKTIKKLQLSENTPCTSPGLFAIRNPTNLNHSIRWFYMQKVYYFIVPINLICTQK